MVCRLALAVYHVIPVNTFDLIGAIGAIQERFLEQLAHRALTAMQEPIPVLVRQIVHHVRQANILVSVKVPAILAL